MRKINILILLIILISFAFAWYLYPLMPERMASHWNVRGEVDGYMPKFWGLFLMPIVALAMFLLFLLIPRIDPLKKNIEKFRKYFDWFALLIILFLLYIYKLSILWNFGWRFDMGQVLAPAFAILFYFSGILISKAKRNWFIGIRTPWTMTNDIVWDKTHKLGAILFKISGAICLFGLLLPAYAFAFVLAPVILFSIYLIIYSYLEYRKVAGA
jgi:uncharacterized membrane protein